VDWGVKKEFAVNRLVAKISLVLTVVLILSGCVPAVQNTVAPTATQPPAADSPVPAIPTETVAPPEPTQTTSPQATQMPSPQDTQAPPAEPQALPAPRLVRLAMIDEQNGWALGEGQVLRTVDGGASWMEASPPGAAGTIAGSFFLDTATGWALYPDPADFNRGTLYLTMDGGQSWESTAAPFGGGFLQFLDAESGWALFVAGAAAGSAPADIFHTQDGGRTWTKVYGIDPFQEDPDGLPFSGMKSGLAFVDEMKGWVTGSVPMEGYAWLFMTEDSGQTWQQQLLAPPGGYTNAMLSIEPPRFFSPQAGLLPVLLSAETPALVFYSTQDGGATWTATTPVEGGGQYDFISTQLGWVWNELGLFATQDGGQTWNARETNVDLSETLAQFDFVSSTTGWALAMDAEGNTQLYKTVDGGSSWISP
jgi:photosystem II stability/assembly factor-like uncharacterized protein